MVLTGQGEQQSLTKVTQIHVLYFTYRAKVLMEFCTWENSQSSSNNNKPQKTGALEHWVFAEVGRK